MTSYFGRLNKVIPLTTSNAYELLNERFKLSTGLINYLVESKRAELVKILKIRENLEFDYQESLIPFYQYKERIRYILRYESGEINLDELNKLFGV